MTTPILAPPSTEAKPQASSTPLVSGLSAGEVIVNFCRLLHRIYFYTAPCVLLIVHVLNFYSLYACTAETTPKASLPLDSESPTVSLSSAAKPSVPVEQQHGSIQLLPPQPVDTEVIQAREVEPVTRQVRRVESNASDKINASVPT